MLAFFSSFGQTYFIALSGAEIRAQFGLTHGAFGSLYSLATLASGCCLIWAGHAIDRVDLRVFTAVVSAGLIAACLLMGLASTALLLVVALFLLRLSGQGLMTHTAMTSMARYFHETRGKAMSVAALGFPAGEAALPTLAVAVIATAGWQATWRWIGLGLLVVMTPLLALLLRGHGRRHRAHLASLTVTPSGTEAARAERAAAQHQWTRREVLGDLRFWMILPAVLAPAFIGTGIFFHQLHLVESKGWAVSWFAGCFAGFAATQLPASLLAGPLVDRAGATRLLPVYLAPLGLGLLALAMGSHPSIALVFLVLTGVTAGAVGPIVGGTWPELYGVVHLGGIRAVAAAAMVFSTALAPVSMGWLIDAGVSMESIALMCAAYVLVASVLARIALARQAGRSARRTTSAR